MNGTTSPAPPQVAPERPRSTTRRWLWRLRAGLLATTAVVLVTSVWAFQGVHTTVDTASTRTVPAILEIAEARAALAEADLAAVESFQAGESQLASFQPGERYQNQIVIASQRLAQAAEDNARGEADSRALQLVEGLLVSYTGYVGQAGANYQQDDTVLGTADLLNASRLLHREPDGILAQLDQLLAAHETTLDRQLSSGWTHPATVLVWAVPAAALLALLLATQVFLRSRFRRTLNLWLLAATVLLLVLASVTGLAQDARNRLADAENRLDEVADARTAEASAASAEAQEDLAVLVEQECGQCGHTLEQLNEDGAGTEAPEPASPAEAQADARAVNEQAVVAGGRAWLVWVILALTAGVALLATVGLRPRIDEYRYQNR